MIQFLLWLAVVERVSRPLSWNVYRNRGENMRRGRNWLVCWRVYSSFLLVSLYRTSRFRVDEILGARLCRCAMVLINCGFEFLRFLMYEVLYFFFRFLDSGTSPNVVFRRCLGGGG
ncbi:hypothetical protein F4604DRAFT_1743598 [Suillus subluteus]|nr:hypothetical protein F4604DRAFT_1743598 [Suillus subluteus]